MPDNLPEPWLCGTLTEVPSVIRAVFHALELAREDLERHCGGLSDVEVNAAPCRFPPVAFQLRHVARSVDRLLTYAEGRQLDAGQIEVLKSGFDAGARKGDLFKEAGFTASVLLL